MKIVNVSGAGDFSALEMERSGELTDIVYKMINANITQMESKDGSIVEILEFGDIDRNFIYFITDDFIDYDYLKSNNFYILEDLIATGECIQ